jgi:hypothetical protein
MAASIINDIFCRFLTKVKTRRYFFGAQTSSTIPSVEQAPNRITNKNKIPDKKLIDDILSSVKPLDIKHKLQRNIICSAQARLALFLTF